MGMDISGKELLIIMPRVNYTASMMSLGQNNCQLAPQEKSTKQCYSDVIATRYAR